MKLVFKHFYISMTFGWAALILLGMLFFGKSDGGMWTGSHTVGLYGVVASACLLYTVAMAIFITIVSEGERDNNKEGY